MSGFEAAARSALRLAKRPQRLAQNRRIAHDRVAIAGKSVTIVTGDCWGSAWYQQMGRDYTTPFVAIRVMAACYARLLTDVQGYLSQPLRFIDSSIYASHPEAGRAFPLARLGDIELQFVHYSSEEEAVAKWTRRLSRMDVSNMRYKVDLHKDGLTDDILADIVRAQPDVLLVGDQGSPAHVKLAGYTIDGAHMLSCSTSRYDLTPWILTEKPGLITRRINPLAALSGAAARVHALGQHSGSASAHTADVAGGLPRS